MSRCIRRNKRRNYGSDQLKLGTIFGTRRYGVDGTNTCHSSPKTYSTPACKHHRRKGPRQPRLVRKPSMKQSGRSATSIAGCTRRIRAVAPSETSGRRRDAAFYPPNQNGILQVLKAYMFQDVPPQIKQEEIQNNELVLFLRLILLASPGGRFCKSTLSALFTSVRVVWIGDGGTVHVHTAG